MSREFDLGRIRGGAGPAGPAGSPGPTGPRGPVGPCPDIAIGRVETAPAGSSPWVRRRDGSPAEHPLLDFGLPLSGDMSRSLYDPQGLQQDIFAYAAAHAGLRPASCVVAAADSAEQSKADFVCSGEADQLTLRQALSSLPHGGCLQLLAGTYVLDGTALSADADDELALLSINQAGIRIVGEGPATVLRLAEGVCGAESDPLLLIKAKGAGFGLERLTICGNSEENAGPVTGLSLTAGATGAEISGLTICDCSRYGLELLGTDCLLYACCVNGCDQGLRISGAGRAALCRFEQNRCGVYINGGRLALTGCHFCDNLELGLYGIGGKYLQLFACRFYGQPQAVSLSVCNLIQCCGNIITREREGGEWDADEFAFHLSGCSEPLVLANFLLGSSLQAQNCSSPYFSLSGNDWNIS